MTNTHVSGTVLAALLMLLMTGTLTAQTSPQATNVPWNGYYPTVIENNFSTIIGNGGTLVTGTANNNYYSYDVGYELPFDFEFMGTTYPEGTEIAISSNGYIGFGGKGSYPKYVPMLYYYSSSSSFYAHYNKLIMVWWAALNTGGITGGGVYTKVSGDVLIVEWHAKPGLYGATTDAGNVQARLDASDGSIEVHFGSTSISMRRPSTGYQVGYGALVGIRNQGQRQLSTGPSENDDDHFLVMLNPSTNSGATAITRVPTINYLDRIPYYPVWYAYYPSYDGSSPTYYLASDIWHYDFPTDGSGSQVAYRMGPESSGSVELTSPTGDESWCTGSSQSVTWSSSDVTSVVIEYETGGTWTEICSVDASNGSCSWTLPDVPASSVDVRIRDASDADVSDVATIEIAGVDIASHPSDQSVTAGSTATFTAAANGTTTVQWQQSSDGETWSDMTGETSTTLSFTTSISQSGTQYQAVFNDGTCSTPTTAATLTVTVDLTDIGPAVLFFGATSEDDVDQEVDVKVEIYRNGSLISSGQTDAVALSGTTLNGSKKTTVSLSTLSSDVGFEPGDELSVKVSGRRTTGTTDLETVFYYNEPPAGASGSGGNGGNGGGNAGTPGEGQGQSGSAGSPPTQGGKGWSSVEQTNDGGQTADYFYLLEDGVLDDEAGTGGLSIQKSLGSSWVEFGTWTIGGSLMKGTITPEEARAGDFLVSIQPNPTEGKEVTIDAALLTSGPIDVRLYDVEGRQVLYKALDAAIGTLDLSGVRSGTYLVVVRSKSGTAISRMIVEGSH